MRFRTVTTLVLSVLSLGAVSVFAHQPSDDGFRNPLSSPPLFEFAPPPPIHQMDSVLQEQVEELLEAEQQQAIPLIQRLHLNGSAIRKASRKRPFDEVLIGKLVGEYAKLKAELMLLRLRTENRIKLIMEERQNSKK